MPDLHVDPLPGPATGRPVVGFDLDLTLVASADGIAATLSAVGLPTATAEVVGLVGLPLPEVIAARAAALDAPADDAAVRRLTEDYRQRYPRTGIPGTRPLPGAAAALDAVHELGGQVAVVSAKAPYLLAAMLREVGLDRRVDVTAGGLFAETKGVLLADLRADVYVGDHVGDVVAARTGGALAVGVATGPYDVAGLTEAGADVVLPDLLGFADWLRRWWVAEGNRNDTGGRHR